MTHRCVVVQRWMPSVRCARCITVYYRVLGGVEGVVWRCTLRPVVHFLSAASNFINNTNTATQPTVPTNSRSLRARPPSLECSRSVNHGVLMTPPTALPFLRLPQTRTTNQHIPASAARLFFCLANKIKKAKREGESEGGRVASGGGGG